MFAPLSFFFFFFLFPAGDFNGDGKRNIVLLHLHKFKTVVWYMSNIVH